MLFTGLTPKLSARARPTRARPTAAMVSTTPDRAASLHATAWTLVGTLAFMLLFPVVLLRGMFLDGIIYATISRNMAEGLGDLWHPFFTATLLNPYYESPTLAFLIQSWFFRALGDVWWVERLYSVLTAVLTAGVIVLIWRRLLLSTVQLRRFAWWAIALWILMPGWFWIYRHNLLENTLGLFAALSVYASLRAMEKTRWWAVWTLVAAAAITAAILSKGPVGLFPAITPAIAWLTMRQQSIQKSLMVQMVLAIFLAGCIGLVVAQPAAREYLPAYFEQQVVASLQGQRDVVESPLGRFHLAWALMVDLALSAVAAGAIVLFARHRRNDVAESGLGRPTVFCLLTAASASLPIMISPKQSAYYAAPSWPFYTLALALWSLPAISALTEDWIASEICDRLSRKIRIAAAAMVIVTLAASPLWHGLVFRDRELIDDVARIGKIVAPHSKIQIDPELRDAYSLHAYLYRRHYISLERSARPDAYYLEPAESESNIPANYTLVDAGLTQLRLYVRSEITTASGPTEPAQ